MAHKLSNLSRLSRILGAGALAAAAGCHHAPHTPACADIPPGAIPPPSGLYTCQWQTAQAERAELDDFVLYGNEWLEKSAQLAPCGRAHLDVLVGRLEIRPVEVVIQASPDPQLDQARQAMVVEYLASKGVAQAGQRVVVGCPEAEGLYGFEAPRIIRGYSQSGTFGAGTGSRGTGFFGGFGGFGSGYGGGGFDVGGFF
jgi:hypothetical protein